MENQAGHCPHCFAALTARQIDEIQFLHCLACGYIELDRSDDPFSGYVDEAHIRRIKIALSRAQPAASVRNSPRRR
jgi:Zn-finger nucleic acid-binding protein